MVVYMSAKHRGKVQDKKSQSALVKRQQTRDKIAEYLALKQIEKDFSY